MGTKNNPGEFDCYENAEPDEPIFVLSARDPSAPLIVRQWAFHYKDRKIANGTCDDAAIRKFAEAIQCSRDMQDWRKRRAQ